MTELRGLGWTRQAALSMGCVAMLALGACNSTGPGSDAQSASARHSGDLQDDPYFKSGLRLVWRAFPEQGTGQRVRFITPTRDVVLFQDTGNTLSLIEDESGRVRWTVSLGQSLEKFVGVARFDNSIIAASETELQFFDVQNGGLTDRQRLSGLANTPPVIVNPIAVFGTSTGRLFGHDLSIGVRRWEVQLDGPVTAPVVPAGGRDFAAVSAGGEFIIANAFNGTSAGRRGQLFDDVSTEVVTDGSNVYIAGLDQSVWAYSLANGDRVWRYRTESELDSQPIVAEGTVIVHADREGLLGIDARNGDLRWRNTDAMGDAIGTFGNEVYLWDGSTLTVIAISDGSVRSSEVLPGILEVVVAQDGVIYAVGADGVVSKYQPLL